MTMTTTSCLLARWSLARRARMQQSSTCREIHMCISHCKYCTLACEWQRLCASALLSGLWLPTQAHYLALHPRHAVRKHSSWSYIDLWTRDPLQHKYVMLICVHHAHAGVRKLQNPMPAPSKFLYISNQSNLRSNFYALHAIVTRVTLRKWPRISQEMKRMQTWLSDHAWQCSQMCVCAGQRQGWHACNIADEIFWPGAGWSWPADQCLDHYLWKVEGAHKEGEIDKVHIDLILTGHEILCLQLGFKQPKVHLVVVSAGFVLWKFLHAKQQQSPVPQQREAVFTWFGWSRCDAKPSR